LSALFIKAIDQSLPPVPEHAIGGGWAWVQRRGQASFQRYVQGYVVNAAQYYMMTCGVKIRLNMSPNDRIFIVGHAEGQDVLKKQTDCSR